MGILVSLFFVLVEYSFSSGLEANINWNPDIMEHNWSGDTESLSFTQNSNGVKRVYTPGYNDIVQLKQKFDIDYCPKIVSASVSVTLSDRFLVNNGMHKLALGIYGPEDSCVSGGCAESVNRGVSIRVVLFKGLWSVYTYGNQERGFGKLYSSNVTASGTNFLQLEVTEVNSSTLLIVLSINEVILLTTELNVVDNVESCITGALFTDMQGGKPQQKSNWFKRKQWIMYEDYEFVIR